MVEWFKQLRLCVHVYSMEQTSPYNFFKTHYRLIGQVIDIQILFVLYTSGNSAPGSRAKSDLVDTQADSVYIHCQLVLKGTRVLVPHIT